MHVNSEVTVGDSLRGTSRFRADESRALCGNPLWQVEGRKVSRVRAPASQPRLLSSLHSPLCHLFSFSVFLFSFSSFFVSYHLLCLSACSSHSVNASSAPQLNSQRQLNSTAPTHPLTFTMPRRRDRPHIVGTHTVPDLYRLPTPPPLRSARSSSPTSPDKPRRRTALPPEHWAKPPPYHEYRPRPIYWKRKRRTSAIEPANAKKMRAIRFEKPKARVSREKARDPDERDGEEGKVNPPGPRRSRRVAGLPPLQQGEGTVLEGSRGQPRHELRTAPRRQTVCDTFPAQSRKSPRVREDRDDEDHEDSTSDSTSSKRRRVRAETEEAEEREATLVSVASA